MISDKILKVLDSCDAEMLHSICHELLHRREEVRKTCKWRRVDWGVYQVCTGQHVAIIQHQFCPFCGHGIEETP